VAIALAVLVTLGFKNTIEESGRDVKVIHYVTDEEHAHKYYVYEKDFYRQNSGLNIRLTSSDSTLEQIMRKYIIQGYEIVSTSPAILSPVVSGKGNEMRVTYILTK